jgi:hypothetical protein
MSQELEVLDQLLGGDLPLDAFSRLFPDQDRCRRAIQAMLMEGHVRIVDAQGVALLKQIGGKRLAYKPVDAPQGTVAQHRD